MTLDELRTHIKAVVYYNWPSEYDDALENGPEGHVIESLIALAAFIGEPPNPSLLAELYGCKRCGSTLDGGGYCTDETCPHSDHKQDETWTEG